MTLWDGEEAGRLDLDQGLGPAQGSMNLGRWMKFLIDHLDQGAEDGEEYGDGKNEGNGTLEKDEYIPSCDH